jgi:hypothetical protein
MTGPEEKMGRRQFLGAAGIMIIKPLRRTIRSWREST